MLDFPAVSRYLPVLKKNMILSDVSETVPEIMLLLGPNVLGKFLTGTVERLDDWLNWLFKLVIQTNVTSRLF